MENKRSAGSHLAKPAAKEPVKAKKPVEKALSKHEKPKTPSYLDNVRSRSRQPAEPEVFELPQDYEESYYDSSAEPVYEDSYQAAPARVYEPAPAPEKAKPKKKSKAEIRREEKLRREEEKLAARRAKEEEKAAAIRAKEEAKEAAIRAKEEAKEEKRRQRRESGFTKKLTAAIIVLLVLVFAAAGGLGYWGYKVTLSDTIMPNVIIDGVNVGSLTKADAVQLLNVSGWNAYTEEPFKVTLPLGIEAELDYFDAGLAVSPESVVDTAFAVGHDNRWSRIYSNLFKYLGGFVSKTEIGRAENAVNSEYISAALEPAIASFEQLTAEGGYTINEEKTEMSMMKGGGQLSIDRTALSNAVIAALLNGEKGYDCVMDASGVRQPDFDAIYKELAIEPIDAYYNAELKEIVPAVDGFTFDVQTAKTAWDSAKLCETVSFPVKVVEPEMTTEKLEGMLFTDILGKMTTGFASSNENRINNLELACSKIDGIVLNPGDVFSYNETLGQRTEEAGFLPAGAYLDGEVVEEIGGGICQVSSTLYAATLYARLETVDRTNHYFAVAYMDKGIDATVSWPKPDFKFRNNTEYPIKIVAWFDRWDTRSLTIAIFGTDVDHYSSELWHETFTHTEDYEYNGNIYYGTPTAIVTCTYRNVYDEAGNLLYTEPVNINAKGDVYYDYYFLHKEDIIANLPKIEAPAPSDGGGGGDAGGEVVIE